MVGVKLVFMEFVSAVVTEEIFAHWLFVKVDDAVIGLQLRKCDKAFDEGIGFFLGVIPTLASEVVGFIVDTDYPAHLLGFIVLLMAGQDVACVCFAHGVLCCAR